MADILERIDAAIERITSGRAAMRVPAEETDPDMVLCDCHKEIVDLRAALATSEERLRKAERLADQVEQMVHAEPFCSCNANPEGPCERCFWLGSMLADAQEVRSKAPLAERLVKEAADGKS